MHHILGLVISVMRYLTDTPRYYAGAADGLRNNLGVTDCEISRGVTDHEISCSVRQTDREITRV